MNKTYDKEKVYTLCLSPTITDVDCVCVYHRNYPTVEIEFEHCNCCEHTSDNYADTEFNKTHLKKLEDAD